MFIRFVPFRQEMGYACTKDLESVKQIKKLLGNLENYIGCITEKGNSIFVFAVRKENFIAGYLLLSIYDLRVEKNILTPIFDRGHTRPRVASPRRFDDFNKPSLIDNKLLQNNLLKLSGGDLKAENNRLLQSLLSKVEGTNVRQVSVNKAVSNATKGVGAGLNLGVNKAWEHRRLIKFAFNVLTPLDQSQIRITKVQLGAESRVHNLKGFAHVKNDFESRLAAQKSLNAHDSKLWESYYKKRARSSKFRRALGFARYNPDLPRQRKPTSIKGELSKSGLPNGKTSSILLQEQKTFRPGSLHFSKSNQLDRTMADFPLRQDTAIAATTGENTNTPSVTPTKQLFSINPPETNGRERYVQDITQAFGYFKQRMTTIAQQYEGAKKEYFLVRLDEVTEDRFRELATPWNNRGKTFMGGILEAETALQAEFEQLVEPSSIVRVTEAEAKAGNGLDYKFIKGIVQGNPDTLNGKFTHLDVKGYVSSATQAFQAQERLQVSGKPQTTQTMYEQGFTSGLGISDQKGKHCKPDSPYHPASPENVLHVTNFLEQLPGETAETKAGLMDALPEGIEKRDGTPISQITPEQAVAGILFLNEDITIPRIN